MNISREEFEKAIKIVEEAVINGNAVNEKGYIARLLFTQRYGLQVISRLMPDVHVNTPPGTTPGRYTVECHLLGVRFKSDKEILKDRINELTRQIDDINNKYSELERERNEMYKQIEELK